MIDPLMLNLPMEIRTPRLLLRAPSAGDGETIFPTARASLEELKAWMPWASDTYAVSDAEQWCRRSAAQFLGREILAFLLLHEGKHVGNASIFAFNWKVPKCEIGYWLATSACGKGLMTEAVNALVEFGFAALSMRRIEIRVDARNHRSARVAERCGFQQEGILRSESLHVDGTVRDMRIFSTVRPGC